jgi:fluoroacetyl-CoA thioesterase
LKPSLSAGLQKTVRIEIDRARTIGFMGDEGRVYATPSMVLDFEMATRQFLLEHLDDGEDSVGAHVSIDHLGPTLEGDTVEMSLKIVKVDGHMRDTLDACGRGLHRRFIVDVARQYGRLAARKAKLAEKRRG